MDIFSNITGTKNSSFKIKRNGLGALIVKSITPSSDSTAAIQITDSSGNNIILNIDSSNKKVGINKTTPLAFLHLGAGSNNSNSAPLKIDIGTLMTNAETGAFEFDGDFYKTKSNNVRYSDSGMLHIGYADLANSGSNQTDLQTYTLPANTLSKNGSCIRIRSVIKWINNGNSKRSKLYFGSEVLWDTGATPSYFSNIFIIDALIIRTGATTQKGLITISGTSTNFSNDTSYYVSTRDLTQNQVLKFTGQGTANGDIYNYAMLVEYISGI